MTLFTDQQRLVDALRQRLGAQVIETHISWVLLAGDQAWKIKKALDLGFLDYRTLALRKHCCEEELRLNRRTAPDLYLEVAAIGGSTDDPQFDAHPVIEYAVRMRRFAADALMDTRLQQGRVSAADIDALAHRIVRLHETAAVCPADSPYGEAMSIRRVAMQNFLQLREVLTETADLARLAALETATAAAWQACSEAFMQRKAQGCVRECHGDLHLGNIAFINDLPVPFDAIEFNPALRWIDVMDEIAFAMMDLLHHGRADLAWRFLNACLEASGDYEGVAVLSFYLAYRATVRAKVAALSAAQGMAEHARQMASCRAHLALAKHCLDARHPALLITHGLPGSGKTTFAQYALQQLGALRIRSDVERKRLHGLHALQPSRASGMDIYSAQATERTYERLLQLARTVLQAGHTVIVDAAFLHGAEREAFRRLAQEMDVPFAIATLAAAQGALRQRLSARRNDASEADADVLDKLSAHAQPLRAEERRYAAHFTTETPPQQGDNARAWRRLCRLLAMQ